MQAGDSRPADENQDETDAQADESAEALQADVDQALEDVLGDSVVQAGPPTDDQRVVAAEKEVLVVRAEMENFRKRMMRDSEQQLKYANIGLMRDLLDVVDNLQRALGAASNDPGSQALSDGVAMVSHQLTDVLSKHGCNAVEALGKPFDPNFHEAISQMPSEEYEQGSVMNEVGVGYVLHDRVVRPSHVIVSTGKPEE